MESQQKENKYLHRDYKEMGATTVDCRQLKIRKGTRQLL